MLALIWPAIKPAALNTKTGKVGVLATEGTLGSDLFHNTSNKHASSVKIIEQSGRGLVPLIEQGKIDGDEIKNLLKKYNEGNYDSLATGFHCTYEPWGKSNRPRQEIGGFFYDDGNVYILSSDLLEKHNPTTCGDRPFQYHTHRYHNHEIDDDFDLMISDP